jgi:hypothetical protein
MTRQGEAAGRAREVEGEEAETAGQTAGDKAEVLRQELDVLLDELKLRGKRMFDLRYQLRNHPGVVAGAGLLVLAGAAVGVAGAIRRRRRARSLQGKLQRIVAALSAGAALGSGTVAAAGRKAGPLIRQQASGTTGVLAKQLLMLALPRLLPLVLGKLIDKRHRAAGPALTPLPRETARRR